MDPSRAILNFIPSIDDYRIEQPPHLWNVNSVRFDTSSVTISGWCLPFNGRLGETELLINGQAYRLIPRKPVGLYSELYPWYPNAAWSEFELRIPFTTHDLRQATEVSMIPRCAGTMRQSPYGLSVLVRDLSFNMPPADIAARIGVTNLPDYVILGRSIFRSFEQALSTTFGTTFADYPLVVDWGCGSGRVARHVVNELRPSQDFVGFDIDAQAVAWASDQIGPWFKTCRIEPPLDLPAGSVDLVYGYSVITHLPERDIKMWVSEVARILRPGGIVLLTILADTAMIALHSNPSPSTLYDWKSRGIYDSVPNSQLDDVKDLRGDYYRNVWVTRQFVTELMSEKFDFLRFREGFHFYQDLVMARRR